MIRTIKLVFILSSILQAFLSFKLIVSPQEIISGFGIPASETADMIARRAGVLFFGMGVMTLLVSIFGKETIIKIFGLALSVTWLGMAYESFFEWQRGFAGSGIVAPMIVEFIFGLFLLLASALAIYLRSGSKPA